MVFSDFTSCLSVLEHGKVSHSWLGEVEGHMGITFVWVSEHAMELPMFYQIRGVILHTTEKLFSA